VKGWGESVSTTCVGKNTGNCIQYILTVALFTFCTCCILRYLVCIVVSRLVCIVIVVLCSLLPSYVHLLYYVCIAVFTLEMTDCWLEVSIRKVLRPATSTKVFLGFPLSISKC